MPTERPHVQEDASVQITPAPQTPDPTNLTPSSTSPATSTPQEDAPAVNTTKNPLQKIAGVVGGLLCLLLLASVACTPNTAPSHNETAGLADGAQISTAERPAYVPASVPFVSTGNPADEPTKYGIRLDLTKCYGEVAVCTPDQAYEVRSDFTNLLTTAGATALWNGLSTAGLATPFNTTNAQLAVGDGTTAAAVGDTDLGAAAGTAVAVSGATNATPIVLTTAAQSWVVGQVIVCSSIGGNTAANGTFEISAVTSTSATLLNSAGNAAYTTGGSCSPINKYRQQANGTGSAAVSGNQITYVATFGTANANFAWQEWGLTTGAAATNKQAAAPPTLFNHKIVSLGTKTSAASWTLTANLSLN